MPRANGWNQIITFYYRSNRRVSKLKIAIVNSKDLEKSEDNPTMCWSPLRYCSGCIGCETLTRAARASGSVDEALSRIKCKPMLQPDGVVKLEKYIAAKKAYKDALTDLKEAGI